MKILILGGTAFIGYHVVKQLKEKGHELFVFNRGNRANDIPDGVMHIQGDKTNLVSFREKFQSIKPDVVLDMVPIGEKDSAEVMETFRGITSRVVAISSCDVYRAYGRLTGSEPGIPDEVPLFENSPLREKLYPYKDKTDNPRLQMYDKILVEKNVMNDKEIKGTILRLPMVFGPRDYQYRFLEYLRRMDDGRDYILIDQETSVWKTNRAYVDDIAHAIVLAVEKSEAAGQIFNVAEENSLTEKEFIEKIARYAGWSGEIIVYQDENESEYPRQDLVTDTSKIRKMLGFNEITQEDVAYKNTIEWERNNEPEGFKINYTEEDKLFNKIKSNIAD